MPNPNMSVKKEKLPLPKPRTEVVKRAQENKKVILNMKAQDLLKLVTPGADFRSHLGQFGWVTVGIIHIPHIFREEHDCYVAVRIINQQILPRFCNTFTQELFDILVLRSVTMTYAERRLYNDINFNHCNCDYGLNAFQRGEQLVKVDDVFKLYDLLKFLYSRFVLHKNELHPNFGYMSFDKQNNLVPYYRINGLPCFPIIYFEGDDKFLQEKSIPVCSFGECVLKILMKLQHISIYSNNMRVITFNDLKLYYEKDAVFIDCWVQRERYLFINRSKSESSILKIMHSDGINLIQPEQNINTVPVLLANTKKKDLMRPWE